MLRTSMKAAAAVLAAGIALTACGTVRMGAAAIAGNQRITSAALTDQAANLSAAYQEYRKKTHISYPQTEIPQQVLSWLLRFRVRDALAQQERISVTPAEQQHALAALTDSVRQSGFTSLAEAGVANGLPPDLISQLANYQAIGEQLVTRLDGGKTPTTTAGQNALNAALVKAQCLASKQLGITVNPQYGVFDYNQLAVVSAPATLSAPQAAATPAPGSTTKPQLTPPC